MSDIPGLNCLTRQGEDYIWRPAVAAMAEIERLRARIEELEAVLRKLDKSGGLGYDKHDWISAALAAKGGGT